MSSMHFFMLSDEFFEVLRKVNHTYKFKLSFTRYSPASMGKSIWHTAELDEDLIHIYEEYETIYISLGKVPANGLDSDFFEMACDELIEFSGGKISGNVLSISYLRVINKVSKARKLFDAIAREVKNITHAGGLVANGAISNKIRYSERSLLWELRNGTDGAVFCLNKAIEKS